MPQLHNFHKIFDPEVRAKNIRATKYWIRGLYWRVTRPESPDPVFIVGCSRSGTSVTFETIGSSSQLRSFGYELPRFWNGLWGPLINGWESEAARKEHAHPKHREAALCYFYERLGRGRVLDKSCINIMRVLYLFALFPKAQFVYIQRDGRDNVSSLIEGWKTRRYGLEQFLGKFPCPVRIDNGRYGQWSFFLPPGWREYNESALEEVCAYQWITANRMALDAKNLIPQDQWIHVRYEDTFHRPVEMFEEIFTRLSLRFDEKIRERCKTLSNRHTSIVNGPPEPQKWRKQNPEAITRIMPKIEPMMLELGYHPGR